MSEACKNSTVRRRANQAGHAMLEGALVIIPFLAIFFAIFDFGMVIFLKNTFQNAAREGVRYAVTYQTVSGMGQDASIKSVVKTNAMGFLNSTATCGANNDCIAINYYNPTTLAATTANAPGNIVEIVISGYTWGVMAPVMRSGTGIPVRVTASDRMESLPGGVSPPAR
ncbi:MAG: pilus assembly protein [Candidatus Solibacter usitatus]|nr:pilus assembly protein [Candidatus Solibacter usitatus]